MEKQLPEFPVGGVPFIVDVDYNLLRDPGDERNTISFIDDMEDKGSYYNLYIDSFTGEPTTFEFLDPNMEYIIVPVPQMVVLDPEGVAAKYGIAVDKLPVSDKELRINPDHLQIRAGGKLPEIEICGHPFFIDVRIGLLRPKDDFSTMGIELSKLEMDDSGTKYLCLYDPDTHTTVSFDPSMTSIPEGIVALEIPYENILDSYAVARARDLLEDSEWFRNFPPRTGLIAQTIPWEKTSIPAIIAKNIPAQKKPDHKKVKRKGRSI